MLRQALAVVEYKTLLTQVAETIHSGRKRAAWSLNAIMWAVFWEIGRQIVSFQQKGSAKAEYGERVMELLAQDLEERFGRGLRKSNLYQFRRFYLVYQNIFQTASGKFKNAPSPRGKPKFQTVSGKLTQPGENPPVGLVLSSEQDDAVAHYSLDGLPNKILAREYQLVLPKKAQLAAQIEKARHFLENRSRKVVSTKS